MSEAWIIILGIVLVFVALAVLITFISMWRMNRELIERHNYVQFEAQREEMLYREREHKASKDRVEGLCKEYEETFRAMQIMDELAGRS